MALGSRSPERFWITLTVRFAFGFLFLIAAVSILFLEWDQNASFFENLAPAKIKSSLTTFADIQVKPYEASWLYIKFQYGDRDPNTGAYTSELPLGKYAVTGFVYSMPFVFLLIAACLLSGFQWRAMLRFSALYLVCLGLGKYIVEFTKGGETTFRDFMYAAAITWALYVTREPEAVVVPVPPARETLAMR